MLIALMSLAMVQTPLAQATPAPVPEVDPCTHDRATLLALPPAAFDQDLSGGWRPLAENPQCAAVAADLLRDYRKAHWGELKSSELHINYWHEGQLRAGLGQTDIAVRLLMAGVNPDAPDRSFAEYATGTVAFLLQDRPALIASRERLAALPKPEGFDEAAAKFKASYGFEITWPSNLNVLDGLIACFGHSYNEAYGDCAVPMKQTPAETPAAPR